MDTSLNIESILVPEQKPRPRARAWKILQRVVLGHWSLARVVVWTGFCHFPRFFPMRPCYTVNTMEQRPFCDRQLGPRNGTWSEHNFRGCLGRISSMSPRQFFSDVFTKPSFLFLVRLVSASFFLEPISWKPQKKPTPDRVGINWLI